MYRTAKELRRYLCAKGHTVTFGLLCVLCCLILGQAQPRRNIRLAVGEVTVIRVSGTARLLASGVRPVSGQKHLVSGMTLTAGDRLKTDPGSFVTLGLPDQSKIEIQPDTDLEILDFSGGLRQLLRIWLGKVRLKIHHLVGKPNP